MTPLGGWSTDAVTAQVAHQDGWDEILLVAGPMAVIVGLLWLAKRRIARRPPS